LAPGSRLRLALHMPSKDDAVKQVLQSRNNGMTVVREVPAPPCLPGNVLVRTAYSVISAGTERARVELSQKSLLGKARERPDLVREVIARARKEGFAATHRTVTRKLNEEAPAGYSCAGEIIEVGEHVRNLRPGDRVACAGAGHANHAEIVSVPANLCARVPDGVALECAAFATIAAIAMHGVRLADPRLGERTAVIGCGLVGQIALRLLRCAGVRTIALDIDPERVAEAERGGADHGLVIGEETPEAVKRLTRGFGVDHAVVAAAAPVADPLVLAATLARDRGTIVLVGAVPIEFPRDPLYHKELSFRVSRSYGPGRYDLEYEERGLDYPIAFVRWTEQRNLESVLDLLADGTLALDDLIDEIVPVEDAELAYARLTGSADQRPRGGIVLDYHADAGAESTNGDGDGGTITLPTRVPGHDGAAPSHAKLAGPPTLGLIGPGSFASRVIVPAFVAEGTRLELVGGGSGPSAYAATRSLGFLRIAEDEDAVIADEVVNTVAVCTRHVSHARLTAAALRAGKHTFVEKPLVLSEVELEDVLDAAVGSRGVLAVGFNRRFAPLVVRLRTHFANGGQPMVASYRVSAGKAALDAWVHDLSQGGGRLLGEGCHFVDTLCYLVGAPVSTVYASGFGDPALPRQAHDNLVVTLTFADGSVGSVTYVAEGAGSVGKERIEAFCGSRTAILDDFLSLSLHDGRRQETVTERTQDKGHRAEIAAFVAGARAGHPPVPLSEVANVSLATLAAVESLRTDLPVRLTTDTNWAAQA
jgi:predicted dehydrogenase/threonine dehydrogenase-like Zn-dependent dehydrogenase